MLVKLIVLFSGIVGSSNRMLLGMSHGMLGLIGLRATITSSSGFIRTVSFQPTSFASGGFTIPSHPTRLINWTLNMCQWMACVSTPLCVIFQIWVPSASEPIGCAASEFLMSSVGGSVSKYGIVVCVIIVVLGISTPN